MACSSAPYLLCPASKATGQTQVFLDGRRRYLRKAGQEVTLGNFHRIVAEWIAGGGRLPTKEDEIQVVDVLLRFWAYAKYYCCDPDGGVASSRSNFKAVIQVLRKHYVFTVGLLALCVLSLVTFPNEAAFLQ